MHVENALKYVFGDVIICEDTETARRLAFDPKIKMTCVTLEGDIYEPYGVITGGFH